MDNNYLRWFSVGDRRQFCYSRGGDADGIGGIVDLIFLLKPRGLWLYHPLPLKIKIRSNPEYLRVFFHVSHPRAPVYSHKEFDYRT